MKKGITLLGILLLSNSIWTQVEVTGWIGGFENQTVLKNKSNVEAEEVVTLNFGLKGMTNLKGNWKIGSGLGLTNLGICERDFLILVETDTGIKNSWIETDLKISYLTIPAIIGYVRSNTKWEWTVESGVELLINLSERGTKQLVEGGMKGTTFSSLDFIYETRKTITRLNLRTYVGRRIGENGVIQVGLSGSYTNDGIFVVKSTSIKKNSRILSYGIEVGYKHLLTRTEE